MCWLRAAVTIISSSTLRKLSEIQTRKSDICLGSKVIQIQALIVVSMMAALQGERGNYSITSTLSFTHGHESLTDLTPSRMMSEGHDVN